MATKTFVNLPVRDLAKTTEFFTGLGFTFDQVFTDETTTCMVISDEAFAMLHVDATFKEFTGRDIPDTAQSQEVLVGLSADSREQVDDLVDRAVAAGADDLGGGDEDYMYMRGFRDIDGHQWSFVYVDMSTVAGS